MIRILLLAASLGVVLNAQNRSDALSGLEARADEIVRVNLNTPTLHALAKLASDEAEDAEFLRALSGVSSIQVLVYEFNDHEMPAAEDLETVRAAAVKPGWTRFLTSRSKDPDELVSGYAGPGGLALVVSEAGEITSVHIDGLIPGNALPRLGRHFGLPALGAAAMNVTGEAEPEPPRMVPPQRLAFGHLVHELEAQEGIHQLHIPMMGFAMKMASPVAYAASGGRVKAIDLAVFENAPLSFTDDVDKVLPTGWTRFVEVREHNERTNIYAGEVDKWMPLLIADRDNEDGVLVTVKASLKDLYKSPADWARHHED